MSYRSSQLYNDDSCLDASTVPTYEEFTSNTPSMFGLIPEINIYYDTNNTKININLRS